MVIPNGFEANYTLGFIRGLVAAGARPVVVSSDEIATRVEAMGVAQVNLRGDQNPRRPAWVKALNMLRYYAVLAWQVWRLRHLPLHFTGVFTNARGLIDGPALSSLFRLVGGTYYYTVHNVLPHNRERSRFFRSLYWFLYRFPHRLVVHTARAADQLVDEFQIPRSRIVTISIGLNEEVTPPGCSPAEARVRLGHLPDSRWVLFFGKADPYKGLDLLLQAWALNPPSEYRLAIVGDCPDPTYRVRIRGLIDALPDPNVVHWEQGFVSNASLALWLTASDLGVLPYRHIYQSGVVFLYLQFGLPILASDVGSLRTFLPEAHRELVPAHDPQALADAMRRFLPRASAMDREAIRLGARKYAWPHVIRPLVNDYASHQRPTVV